MKLPFTKDQAGSLPIEHASYSSVLQYHANVQLFVKTYVRKEWNITDTPAAIVGTCAHRYAEARLQGADELSAQAEANVLFDKTVNDPEKKIDWGKTGTPEGSKAELAIACANAESAMKAYSDAGIEAKFSEQTHTLVCKDATGEEYPVPLKVKIDAVYHGIADDDFRRLVDWKFLSSFTDEGVTNPKYELQAGAYWLGMVAFDGVAPKLAEFVEIKKKEPSLVCKADPARKLLQADLRALCEENGIAFGTYDKNVDLQAKLAAAGVLVKEPAFKTVTVDLSAGYESRPVRAFLAMYERFLTDLWYRTNYDLPTLVNVSEEFGKGVEAYEDFLKESGIE